MSVLLWAVPAVFALTALAACAPRGYRTALLLDAAGWCAALTILALPLLLARS